MKCNCGGNLYSKIEDECSIERCTKCSSVSLNSVGLPVASKYYNLELASQAVFETAEKAEAAMVKTFLGHFSPALWSKLIVEWHKNLHDEVMK